LIVSALRFRVALACALIGVAGCAPSSARPVSGAVAVKLAPLEIHTSKKTVHFKVEVARTPP